ncbi:MAG: hypothetical protein EXS64_09975 [Candidatus Latescibacteria bacterium]|nr:hypothetical protein [Candidatus Latescibacterota bacterium]
MTGYLRKGLTVAAILAAATSSTPALMGGQTPPSPEEAAMAAADEKGRILSPKDMKQISDAIGARCTHCHVAKKPDGKPDYKAPSPLKETAKYMKIHFVDGLVTRDGKPLTCANCHAGKTRFLPHELLPDAPKSSVKGDRMELMKKMNVIAKSLGVKCDFCHAKGPDGKFAYELPTAHKQIAKVMMTEIVDKYKLKDGGELTCATCHAGKTEFLPHHTAEGGGEKTGK